MAPRGNALNVVTKPAASARGKLAKAAVRGPVDVVAYKQMPDRKEVCPLCIEELDATDLGFMPCPCGYRICLFCYEQVKIQCQSKCPGCRREYGTVLDAAECNNVSNGSFDSLEELSTASAATTVGGRAAVRVQGVAEASAGARAAAAAAAAASSGKLSRPGDPGNNALRRASHAESGGKGSSSSMDESVPAAHPPGSTWATVGAGGGAGRLDQASSHTSSHFPPLVPSSGTTAAAAAVGFASTSMDHSAWPSLADSTAAHAAHSTAAHSHRQHQHQRNNEAESSAPQHHHHRRGTPTPQPPVAAATALSPADRLDSSSSLDVMSDAVCQLSDRPLYSGGQRYSSHGAVGGPPGYAEQHSRGHSGSYSLHVSSDGSTDPRAGGESTAVPMQGMQRPPGSSSAGGSDAEGYGVSSAQQQQQQQQQHHPGSNGHSPDAASQLMTLLRHKESNKAQALIAAGKAPPGFTSPQFAAAAAVTSMSAAAAAAPAAQPARPFIFSSSLNNEDNPVVPGPPVGRYSPISPPPYVNGHSNSNSHALHTHLEQHPSGFLSPSSSLGATTSGSSAASGTTFATWLAPVGRSSISHDASHQHYGGGQSSYNSVSGSGGDSGGGAGCVYSLWSTHGLPGIDYGGSPLQAFWQSAAAGTSQQQALFTPFSSGGFHVNDGGLGPFGRSTVSNDLSVSFMGHASTSKGASRMLPPPGFGGDAMASHRPLYSPLLQQQQQQQPIGQRYNPLSGLANDGLDGGLGFSA